MYKYLASEVKPYLKINEICCIPFSGALAETDCMDCPPGQYCEGTGNVFPTGFCDEGFWCGGKSFQRRPYDTGNLTVINGTTK